MSEIRSDYVGFTYNGIHSSELGIVRTSDGSRFNENLLPTMQDKTVQVPGGDGTYYFGSYFTQRQIPVSFAFDELTEAQIERIKGLFSDKKIHSLIFDERPYKVYKVKVTGTAVLKHIPFDSADGTKRIYKGEGTLQFTSYQPCAQSRFKTLDEYSDWNNVNEWAEASGILTRARRDELQIDSIKNKQSQIKIYNPGARESDFTFRINFDNHFVPAGQLLLLDELGAPEQKLEWTRFKAEDDDAYVLINSKLNLVEGYLSNGKKSGNVYNANFSGVYFKIPVCREERYIQVNDLGGETQNWVSLFPIREDTANQADENKIYVPLEYNYYYF